MTTWLLLGSLAFAGTAAPPSTASTATAAPTTAGTSTKSGAPSTSLDHLQVDFQTSGGKNFLVTTPKKGSASPAQKIDISLAKNEVFSTQANVTCETAKKERAFAILTAEELKKPGPLKNARAWIADEKNQKLRAAGPEENIVCR